MREGTTAVLTHAGGRHEDPGDDHLRDGLFRCVRRLAQAGPLFIRDGNAGLEFPGEQSTRLQVHRCLPGTAGKVRSPRSPRDLVTHSSVTLGTNKSLFTSHVQV